MKGILGKIEDFLSGKKTYITAILVGVAVYLQQVGVDIPTEVVYPILSALGLGALRSALSKLGQK